MNLKRLPFSIQDKNQRDLDYAKDYPTLADLMREQNVSSDLAKAVHYRRDLDSLGNLWKLAFGYLLPTILFFNFFAIN